MDRTANNPEPLNWYARVLAEVADTLLDSPDITQALDQAQTDASALRDIVITNFEQIMSSGTVPPLEFVEIPEWNLILPRRFRHYVVMVLWVLLVSSIVIIVQASSLYGTILGCIFL